MGRKRIYSDEERKQIKCKKDAAYRKANAARRAIYAAEYRNKNRSSINAKQRDWRKNNLDLHRQRKKSWHAATQDRPDRIIKGLLNRARRRNYDFDLTAEDIILPDVCPILGLAFTPPSKGLQATSYSLDRIDNSKGYVKGNVGVISFAANKMKREMSVDTILALAAWVKQAIKPTDT